MGEKGARESHTQRADERRGPREKGSDYCYKEGYTFTREYLKLRNWKY